MDPYILELEKWRRAADESLRKENSWLSLAGLFWLEDGQNSFGTDISNKIVFPLGSGAARMGVLDLVDGQVTLRAEENVDLRVDGEIIKEVILKPDTSGDPTEIKWEDRTIILIEREDGYGIRLWDSQRRERVNFPGRVWFPIDENYVVKGSYGPFEKALDLVMGRKNGSDFQDQAQGQINFQLEDQELSLVAFAQEDGSLFTLFHDLSNGNETYPAGRYLQVDPPKGESLEIDFNRAYNPPCAFTDYATCPLPPIQNRLPVAIRAGERIDSK